MYEKTKKKENKSPGTKVVCTHEYKEVIKFFVTAESLIDVGTDH